jgi:hypothetical protein
LPLAVLTQSSTGSYFWRRGTCRETQSKVGPSQLLCFRSVPANRVALWQTGTASIRRSGAAGQRRRRRLPMCDLLRALFGFRADYLLPTFVLFDLHHRYHEKASGRSGFWHGCSWVKGGTSSSFSEFQSASSDLKLRRCHSIALCVAKVSMETTSLSQLRSNLK